MAEEFAEIACRWNVQTIGEMGEPTVVLAKFQVIGLIYEAEELYQAPLWWLKAAFRRSGAAFAARPPPQQNACWPGETLLAPASNVSDRLKSRRLQARNALDQQKAPHGRVGRAKLLRHTCLDESILVHV